MSNFVLAVETAIAIEQVGMPKTGYGYGGEEAE